ncbi:hypothetical protein HY36_16815 [Hyphomonas atlantica]|uniref:Uncharacterized protein n=2 Tax=Hyphomonas atlantica TaxID=1280948 RepID=A0A059E191_9PROT|nr:hypothetical protein HY36_16815 [Hyphomonas atlantica]
MVARKYRKHVEAETVRALIQEQSSQISSNAFEALLSILSALPDRPAHVPKSTYSKASRRISFNEDMRVQLIAELQRTQIVISDLVKRLKHERDRKALAHRLTRWKRGTVDTVPEDEWLSVIEYLGTIPDAIKSTPSVTPVESQSVEVVRSMPPIAKPAGAQKKAALTNMDDTRAVPDLALNDVGPAKPRARMKRYRLGESLKRLGYIVISDELYNRLHEERKRTLLSPRRLLASATRPPPDLTSKQVRDWFLGNTLAAEKEHLEWVLNAYADLPDANDV